MADDNIKRLKRLVSYGIDNTLLHLLSSETTNCTKIFLLRSWQNLKLYRLNDKIHISCDLEILFVHQN